jgi:hypothetical protein
MHVLHEQLRADIRAIAEYPAASRSEMQRGFAELRELINSRIDPLDAAVRRHGIEIEQLKQGRRP